mmetsp:Transcript_59755/g.119950  ORF Transcript_59755/g.119950 Transcript_59755/m.119950 type:complete len:223 (+) Transcript_59755:1012-1680(+)
MRVRDVKDASLLEVFDAENCRVFTIQDQLRMRRRNIERCRDSQILHVERKVLEFELFSQNAMIPRLKAIVKNLVVVIVDSEALPSFGRRYLIHDVEDLQHGRIEVVRFKHVPDQISVVGSRQPAKAHFQKQVGSESLPHGIDVVDRKDCRTHVKRERWRYPRGRCRKSCDAFPWRLCHAHVCELFAFGGQIASDNIIWIWRPLRCVIFSNRTLHSYAVLFNA